MQVSPNDERSQQHGYENIENTFRFALKWPKMARSIGTLSKLWQSVEGLPHFPLKHEHIAGYALPMYHVWNSIPFAPNTWIHDPFGICSMYWDKSVCTHPGRPCRRINCNPQSWVELKQLQFSETHLFVVTANDVKHVTETPFCVAKSFVFVMSESFHLVHYLVSMTNEKSTHM